MDKTIIPIILLAKSMKIKSDSKFYLVAYSQIIDDLFVVKVNEISTN